MAGDGVWVLYLKWDCQMVTPVVLSMLYFYVIELILLKGCPIGLTRAVLHPVPAPLGHSRVDGGEEELFVVRVLIGAHKHLAIVITRHVETIPSCGWGFEVPWVDISGGSNFQIDLSF